MQKCIFVCTLQNLSVLDTGEVVSTSVQVRSNMGGKQDGSLSVFTMRVKICRISSLETGSSPEVSSSKR